MSDYYTDFGGNYLNLGNIQASTPVAAPMSTPVQSTTPFVRATPPSPNVPNSPNRPAWQQDVYQTSPTMANLERAGWTFVRNNPYGLGGSGDGYGEVNVAIREIMDWINSQDWTDPSSWEGRQAPDGTVVVPPAEVATPTEQPTQQDDGNIFTNILGRLGDSIDYGFEFPDIFRDSTLDPTAPFVPTTTNIPSVSSPTSTSSDGYADSTGGDTGTGVDLGNDGVPASDVVAGGQDSNLDDNKVDVNWLGLLGGGALAGATSGLLSGMMSRDRKPSRTTDMVFSDLPEITTLTPTLLSPLYRS